MINWTHRKQKKGSQISLNTIKFSLLQVSPIRSGRNSELLIWQRQYTCFPVRRSVITYACVYAHLHVCMRVCLCVCASACMHGWINGYLFRDQCAQSSKWLMILVTPNIHWLLWEILAVGLKRNYDGKDFASQ